MWWFYVSWSWARFKPLIFKTKWLHNKSFLGRKGHVCRKLLPYCVILYWLESLHKSCINSSNQIRHRTVFSKFFNKSETWRLFKGIFYLPCKWMTERTFCLPCKCMTERTFRRKYNDLFEESACSRALKSKFLWINLVLSCNQLANNVIFHL